MSEDPQDMNEEHPYPDAAPKEPQEHMTYIQFWLPAETKAKLRKLAAQRGITLSEAIRRALNPYLSKVK